MKSKLVKFKTASKNEIVFCVLAYPILIVIGIMADEYILAVGYTSISIFSSFGLFINMVKIENGVLLLKENVFSKVQSMKLKEIKSIKIDRLNGDPYAIDFGLENGELIRFTPEVTYRTHLSRIKELAVEYTGT